MLKILFYDTKSYDRESFEKKKGEYPQIRIDYLKAEAGPEHSQASERL